MGITANYVEGVGFIDDEETHSNEGSSESVLSPSFVSPRRRVGSAPNIARRLSGAVSSKTNLSPSVTAKLSSSSLRKSSSVVPVSTNIEIPSHNPTHDTNQIDAL